MNFSDFKKHDVSTWVSKQKVITSIAEFTLRLETGDKKKPPDDAMIRRADEFIGLVQSNVEGIHDQLYDSYQSVDDDWLKQCGVPANLDRGGVLEYLRYADLIVERDANSGEPYLCQVYFVPEWDEEHGLYLQFRNDKWIGQDDEKENAESAEDDEAFVPSSSEELVDAITLGDDAKAKKLIASGLDINALNSGEIPPLWVAVDQLQPTLVGRLLDYGADPKLKNPDDGSTPLKHAKGRYRELGFAPSKKKNAAMEAMAELAQSIPGNPMGEMKGKLEEIIALLEATSDK